MAGGKKYKFKIPPAQPKAKNHTANASSASNPQATNTDTNTNTNNATGISSLSWYPPDEVDDMRSICESLFDSGMGTIRVRNPDTPFAVVPRVEPVCPSMECMNCRSILKRELVMQQHNDGKIYKRAGWGCQKGCRVDGGRLVWAEHFKVRYPLFFFTDYDKMMAFMNSDRAWGPEMVGFYKEFQKWSNVMRTLVPASKKTAGQMVAEGYGVSGRLSKESAMKLFNIMGWSETEENMHKHNSFVAIFQKNVQTVGEHELRTGRPFADDAESIRAGMKFSTTSPDFFRDSKSNPPLATSTDKAPFAKHTDQQSAKSSLARGFLNKKSKETTKGSPKNATNQSDNGDSSYTDVNHPLLKKPTFQNSPINNQNLKQSSANESSIIFSPNANPTSRNLRATKISSNGEKPITPEPADENSDWIDTESNADSENSSDDDTAFALQELEYHVELQKRDIVLLNKRIDAARTTADIKLRMKNRIPILVKTLLAAHAIFKEDPDVSMEETFREYLIERIFLGRVIERLNVQVAPEDLEEAESFESLVAKFTAMGLV